jgi:hypothetical protein
MGRKGPVPGAHENRPSTRTDLERQSAIWMTALGQMRNWPSLRMVPSLGDYYLADVIERMAKDCASGLLRLIPLRRRVAAVDISGATSRSALSARVIAMRPSSDRRRACPMLDALWASDGFACRFHK